MHHRLNEKPIFQSMKIQNLLLKKISIIILLFVFVLNATAQRNVLLVIADDIGTDYFGCYEDHADTVDLPNVRKLLAKGVRFQNVWSNPVCSATRAGILTGRYSFRTGVGGIVNGIGGSGTIDSAEITIPKLLKTYNTNIAKAQVGKWHLTTEAANRVLYPNKMGFDRYEGSFGGTLTSYTNWSKITDGVSSTVTNYATSEAVNNAVTWLKTQSSKPFFLWLAFNAPHDPFHLPPANLHSYTLSGTTMDINNNPKKYFKAMMQALDTEMGRLFDSLKAMNKFDSTDIIFMGDNGNSTRTAQIADTSRAKGSVYQYGVHVPFIIAGPSVVNPNRVSGALINTADVFATVLELFGYTTWQTQIPTAKPVDSKSILPIIKNQATQVRPWAFTEIFKLNTDSSDGKTMRNTDYKLIKFDYGAQRFYNLTLDPNENNNLLTGSLSYNDVTNYYALCNAMTTLVGSGSFCNNAITTGVENFNPLNKDIKLYPNPSKNKLYLSFSDPTFQVSEIKIIDAVGKTISDIKDMNLQNGIDIQAYHSGFYYLQIIDKKTKNSTIKKFVIQ